MGKAAERLAISQPVVSKAMAGARALLRALWTLAPNALRFVAFAILSLVIARPAFAADASNGERLAGQWCAE
jgi:hypothetical protein